MKVPKKVDKFVDGHDRFLIAGAVDNAHDVNGAAVVPEPPDNLDIVLKKESLGTRAHCSICVRK